MRIKFNRTESSRAAAAGGFTLVELLVGVAMAAIVYAAVFCGVSTTFRILNSSREELRATQIMVSRLEGIRLEAWNANQLFNSSNVPPTFTEYFYPLGLNSTTNQGTVYGGTETITANPTMANTPSYSGNIALVTVSVSWTNGASGVVNVHTRTMSSYVAEYGLQNYVWSSN